MKKLFPIFFLLLVVGGSVYAEKSYVTVYASSSNYDYVRLSGDIPGSMKEQYTSDDFGRHSSNNSYVEFWIGEVLNLLASNGFEVEQMTSSASDHRYLYFLLSKDVTYPSSDIKEIEHEDNQEVTEVARYNLQGLPVDEKEKGIQIIVYSDYTTETVIKE